MGMICKICNGKTEGRRRTCSEECLKKSVVEGARIGGRLTCDQNRQRGKGHYLFKGLPKKLEDPVKKRCRAKVYDAIRRGKLIRQPCEICGEVKSEAHHKDYLRPFEIEWLCRPHHRIADYRDGTKAGDFGHR